MANIIIKDLPPLSDETLKRLKSVKDAPIVYDEDCPESTPAMHKAFIVAAKQRDRIKGKIAN